VVTGFVDVVGKRVFTGEEAEFVGVDSNEPKSEFPTSGTIASIRFVYGLDVGFEFDGAAYTASAVLLCCHCIKTDKEQVGRSRIGEKGARAVKYLISNRLPTESVEECAAS